jgi:hypothetical protein
MSLRHARSTTGANTDRDKGVAGDERRRAETVVGDRFGSAQP